MFAEFSAETITIAIGVITLIVGVVNSIITNKQTLKSHHLQIILSVSESFRRDWESRWNDILDEIGADHHRPTKEPLSDEQAKQVRYMLNWVDWLGAMKSSGALEELDILTSSIEAPVKRILNAGYSIVESDVCEFGAEFWKNLFLVAKHVDASPMLHLQSKYADNSRP